MSRAKFGIQAYMIREDLAKDLPGTLKQLKGWGFEGIELWAEHYGENPKTLANAIAEAGMTLTSWHTPLDMLVSDLDTVIAVNKAAGNKTIILNMLPPYASYSLDAVKAAAGLFSNLAERLGSEGMQFGFHNFGPAAFTDIGGTTQWDCFNETCDPRVKLQLDICTAAMADADIPALIIKSKERLLSIHAKPYTYGLADYSAGMAPMIGEDSLDYSAILKACLETNLGWYLIEYESRERYMPMYAAKLCLDKLKERGY